ncbi:MAG: hypothetical protein RRY22_04850 [Bacilli bacterium]
MKYQYKLIEESIYKKIVKLDYKKLNGFHFKPTNHIEHDGINVNKMTIINYSLVEKVLKRKIKKRLEVYLKYVMNIIETEDDGDRNSFRQVLNDLSRYKDVIMYKYKKYLDQKYLKLLLKKIELLEQELNRKILVSEEKDITKEESHRRR